MLNSSLNNPSLLLDDLVDQFEEAWTHGVPAVEDYFLETSHASFEEYAVELLRIDIERRFGHSEQRTLDDYVRQFPWLRGSPRLSGPGLRRIPTAAVGQRTRSPRILRAPLRDQYVGLARG